MPIICACNAKWSTNPFRFSAPPSHLTRLLPIRAGRALHNLRARFEFLCATWLLNKDPYECTHASNKHTYLPCERDHPGGHSIWSKSAHTTSGKKVAGTTSVTASVRSLISFRHLFRSWAGYPRSTILETIVTSLILHTIAGPEVPVVESI